MYRVSEILSKPVISLYEAKNIGKVINIIFDSKITRPKYLVISSDDENDIAEKYVDVRYVRSMNEDAVTIKNCAAVLTKWNMPVTYTLNPLNRIVYNQSGKVLGSLSDIEFDKSAVKSLIAGENICQPENVLSKSSEIIIINDTGERIKLSPPLKRVPQKDDSRTVTITVNGEQSADITAQPNTQYLSDSQTPPLTPTVTETSLSQSEGEIDLPLKGNAQVTKTPQKSETKNVGYAFLLGKIIEKTITAPGGTIIAKENETVSEHTILLAKEHNKLVQLALHSK